MLYLETYCLYFVFFVLFVVKLTSIPRAHSFGIAQGGAGGHH